MVLLCGKLKGQTNQGTSGDLMASNSTGHSVDCPAAVDASRTALRALRSAEA